MRVSRVTADKPLSPLVPRDRTETMRGVPRDPIPWIVIPLACVLGAALRLGPALSAGFPLGDGGLFLSMVRDLAAHGGHIPRITSYGGEHLPFVYPPLGFYVALALHDITGASFLAIFQYLPPVVCALSVPAFAFMSRALVGDGVAWAASTLLFAALPDAYFSERMGGGITRSFGELFALLALGFFIRTLQNPSGRGMLLAALCSGLTILSHPDWALFVVSSGALIVLVRGRDRVGLRVGLVVLAGSAIVAAPWWVSVLRGHGLETLLAPLTNSSGTYPWYGGLAPILTLGLTDGAGFPLATALALVGLLVSVRRREFLLPAWLLVVLVVDPRADLLRAVIVVALLGGVGFEQVVLPAIASRGGDRRHLLAVAAAAWAAVYVAGAAVAWDGSQRLILSPAVRSAMTWVSRNTPVTARVYVVAGPNAGWANPVEWFPALAGRVGARPHSVGYEWVPHRLRAVDQADRAAGECDHKGIRCVESVSRSWKGPFDYVLISDGSPKGTVARRTGVTCCPAMIRSIRRNAAFRRVYRSQGVEIFRRR